MNFETISSEAFQILRSYDYTCLLYDDEGKQVYEPTEARRFFAKSKNILLSIIDEGEDSSLRLFVAKSLPVTSITGMIDALRAMSTKFGVVFNVRQWDRDEMTPKDFSTRSSVTEGETMNILEGLYGTSRSSYLKLENARMIVRHKVRINEERIGARGRNIEAIFVENKDGERVKFPTVDLAPARALTHHVDHGGSWNDKVGESIMSMAGDYANLKEAARYIRSNGSRLTEDAHRVDQSVRSHLREMRAVFECACKRSRYDEAVETIAKHVSEALTEGEQARIAEGVAALGSLLNTDESCVSEKVLETISRCLKEDGSAFKLGREPKEEDMISVFGQRVSKDAWSKLRHEKRIELRPAQNEHQPEFRTPLQMMCWQLSGISKRCRDDSMANLLGFVAEAVQEATGEARQRMINFIKIVFAVVDEKIKANEEFNQTESLREFHSWIDGFKTGHVVMESRPPYNANPYENDRYTDWLDREVETMVDTFDPRDFLNSTYASDIGWADRENRDTDEMFVTKQDIIAGLAQYLESEFEFAHDTTVDMSDEAKKLYPKVAEVVKKDGFSLEEDAGAAEFDGMPSADDLADEELSREDVLMPQNPTEDLMSEISPATVQDPLSGEETLPDDQYTDRLMHLAGIRGRY